MKIKLVYPIYWQKYIIISTLMLLITSFKNIAIGNEIPKPDILYNFNSLASKDNFIIQGDARILERNGRTGLNATSSNTKLKILKHNINNKKGSLSIWVMSLEDISPAWSAGYFGTDNKYFNNFPLLVDRDEMGNFSAANFSFHINKIWHPGLTIKFKQGTGHDMYNHAAAAANHSDFEKLRWYQLTATWDLEQKKIMLYINGIKVGSHDVTAEKLERDICSDTLFLGNPTLCISSIQFYNNPLSTEDIYNLFRKEVTDYDIAYENRLKHIYAGEAMKKFDFSPDQKWENKFMLSLTKPEDIDSFYVQGYTPAVKITNEGLMIETPNIPIGAGQYEKQVYLWSKKPFEGDLYIEYEFKTLRKGGLSLLMIQASGMQREDFMADYPLRTAGNMNMVAWSSVRNYHWEYYREMNDVRNDIATGAMLKNPYQYPIGFGTLNHSLSHNEWHKLQLLQIGNKIIGAIDGKIIIQGEDNGFNNNGAVYNFGRIAIRCMIRSKMLFRNIKVYNRNLDFDILESIKK
jgi:hypothetical protein